MGSHVCSFDEASNFMNLRSLTCRYLLSGDIPSAEATFKLQQPKTNDENVQKLIDKGLVAVAQNDYDEAYQQFNKAHEIEKNNILVRVRYIL